MDENECIFSKKRSCAARIDKPCRIGGRCGLYKTKESLKASIERANELLRQMPENRRNYLVKKYYDGKKPWEN